MSEIKVEISERAYQVMHMHSIKYHNFDCIGVLIGHVDYQNIVQVENAVPLFHQRVMTGLLEVAFDMIDSLFLKKSQVIIGLYEAALPASLPSMGR